MIDGKTPGATDESAQNFKMETTLNMATMPPAESTDLQGDVTRTSAHKSQNDVDWAQTFDPTDLHKQFRYGPISKERSTELRQQVIDYLKAMPPKEMAKLVAALSKETRAGLSTALTNNKLQDMFLGITMHRENQTLPIPFGRMAGERAFDPEEAGKTLAALENKNSASNNPVQ